MSTPDQDTLVRAIEDARRILGEYRAFDSVDALRTVDRLFCRPRSRWSRSRNRANEEAPNPSPRARRPPSVNRRTVAPRERHQMWNSSQTARACRPNFRSFTYPYLQSPGQKPGFAFQPGRPQSFGDKLHSSPPWKWAIAILIVLCCVIYAWTLR